MKKYSIFQMASVRFTLIIKRLVQYVLTDTLYIQVVDLMGLIMLRCLIRDGGKC